MDVSEILEQSSAKQQAISVQKELPVEFDLGLLAAFDPNPIDLESYQEDKEQVLISNARDGIQLLVNEIWNQPTRIVDEGVVADLPAIATGLPREKPLPKPAPMTKWQAFATAKGIAPKEKKDRMVYDEDKQEWVPRWGYKGKNKDKEEQWIHEVPNGADPNFDPVASAKQDRKARSLKNESQRLRNMQRAAANAATQASEKKERSSARDQKKVELDRALKTTKKSTASVGKFDDKLAGESKEKNVKRKFDANEVSASSERSKSLSILTSIGATPSNKRTRVSDDAPNARQETKGLVNDRKAIKNLTGGRGVTSLQDKRGGKGGRGGRGGKK
ncbi:ribosome biogenesis protein RRS1 [Sporobolomyces salmoneus]|uniref:ribosome biogenesis protein RRS1 n=1 Tax=Sporobolomyces salmoneus TaxID=183962 RepID=UPI003174A898